MKFLKQMQSHADQSVRVMEAETISKNGASLKSHTSKGKSIRYILLLLSLCFVSTVCAQTKLYELFVNGRKYYGPASYNECLEKQKELMKNKIVSGTNRAKSEFDISGDFDNGFTVRNDITKSANVKYNIVEIGNSNQEENRNNDPVSGNTDDRTSFTKEVIENNWRNLKIIGHLIDGADESAKKELENDYNDLKKKSDTTGQQTLPGTNWGNFVNKPKLQANEEPATPSQTTDNCTSKEIQEAYVQTNILNMVKKFKEKNEKK